MCARARTKKKPHHMHYAHVMRLVLLKVKESSNDMSNRVSFACFVIIGIMISNFPNLRCKIQVTLTHRL